MPYDLFISYSRRDNQQNRITQFVERISRDFERFAGRPLRPFFDVTEIQGMDEHRTSVLSATPRGCKLTSQRFIRDIAASASALQEENCLWLTLQNKSSLWQRPRTLKMTAA